MIEIPDLDQHPKNLIYLSLGLFNLTSKIRVNNNNNNNFKIHCWKTNT